MKNEVMALYDQLEKLNPDTDYWEIEAIKIDIRNLLTPEERAADDAFEMMNFNEEMTREFNEQ